jgi:hypothetical protein
MKEHWKHVLLGHPLSALVALIAACSVFFAGIPAEGANGQEETLKDLRQASYPEIGLTSSFMLISPNIGYWFGPIGVRVSGMYIDSDSNELHFNVGYKLSDNEKTQHAVNILASKIVGSDPGADYDFSHIGVAYSMNFSIKGHSGFFFELGLGVVLEDNLGNVEDEPVVPCGSFGYIYRFTR